jgi:hypothetical protein
LIAAEIRLLPSVGLVWSTAAGPVLNWLNGKSVIRDGVKLARITIFSDSSRHQRSTLH